MPARADPPPSTSWLDYFRRRQVAPAGPAAPPPPGRAPAPARAPVGPPPPPAPAPAPWHPAQSKIYNPDDDYPLEYTSNDDYSMGMRKMYNTPSYFNSDPSIRLSQEDEAALNEPQKNSIRQGALGPFFREGAPPVKPMKVNEFMAEIGVIIQRFSNEGIQRKVQNKVANNMAIIIDYRLTRFFDNEQGLDILNLVARRRRVGEELPNLSPQSKRLQGSLNAALTYYENMDKPEETRLYRALTEFNEEIVNLIITGIAYIGVQRYKNSTGAEGRPILAEGRPLDTQTNDDLFEISEYLSHKIYSYLKVEMRRGPRDNWDRHSVNSTLNNPETFFERVGSSGKSLFGRLGKLNPLGGIRKEQLASIRGRQAYPIPTEEQITKYRLSKNALNKGGFSLTKNAYHRHSGFFDQIASLVRNVIRISIGISNVNGVAPRNTSIRGDLGSYGHFEGSKNKFEYRPSEYDNPDDVQLSRMFSLRGAKSNWRAERDATERGCVDAVANGTMAALQAALDAPGARYAPKCADARKLMAEQVVAAAKERVKQAAIAMDPDDLNEAREELAEAERKLAALITLGGGGGARTRRRHKTKKRKTRRRH